MHKIALLLIATTLLFSSCSTDNTVIEQKVEKQYKYDYSQVENDPFNVLEYTLDNGLKVLLDLFQKQRIIKNDMQIRKLTVTKDKSKHPRVEIDLKEYKHLL